MKKKRLVRCPQCKGFAMSVHNPRTKEDFYWCIEPKCGFKFKKDG